jgi:hypothetical protein
MSSMLQHPRAHSCVGWFLPLGGTAMRLAVVLLFVFRSALAIDRVFDNQAGNSLWTTPANWNPDGTPGQFDNARIDAGRSVNLTGNAGWVNSVSVGTSNGFGSLTINPGGIAYGAAFRDPAISILIGAATNSSAAPSEYNHVSGAVDAIGDFVIGGGGGRAVARFYAGNIWIGGTLRLGSYLYPADSSSQNALWRLIGGGGTFTQISNFEIGSAGALSFEFNGGNAPKTMNVTSNVSLLPGAVLMVDGGGYSGGATTMAVIAGATLTGAFSKITFTNFAPALAANVVHANGKVRLLIDEDSTLTNTPPGLRLIAPAQYSFGCVAAADGGVLFTEFPAQRLTRWKTNGQVEAAATGIAGAFNVTSDLSNNIFVGLELGDQGNPSKILRIAPDGTRSYVVTDLTRPRQLATDAAGNVYFATESPQRIRRWNEATGLVDILGKDNIAEAPQGVAVASDGTVYFNNYGNPEAGIAGTLQKISTNGTITVLMSDLSTGRGRGIALDEANDCIYICSEADMEDHGNSGMLIRYRISDGTWTKMLKGLDYPQFPCKGRDGRIYFTLARDDWLVAYDPAAATIESTWPSDSAIKLGLSGGSWGTNLTGSRLKLNIGQSVILDGNIQSAASGGTVYGWLRVPAERFSLSTNQLIGWNGRIFQPNPNSGIYELPTITYEADSGSCLIAALPLREHRGVRWPMANPGTANETPAAGFAEVPADFLIYFAWSTNDRVATILSPPFSEPGGAMTILKGSGQGWNYNDVNWQPTGQTWLGAGKYHAPDPAAWAEVDLGAFCGKSKYIYLAWHVNGPYRPHAAHYTLYDNTADQFTVVVDQTKHADGINHGNDTFSGWRLLGNRKLIITPSTRLWMFLDSSVLPTEYLQSDALLLSDYPLVDNLAPSATNNFEGIAPLSIPSSGPAGVGHHWGMQGLGGQYTVTSNHIAQLQFATDSFTDAPPGYYNIEVSWTYFGSDNLNVTNARFSLAGQLLPDEINQNRAATNQGGPFVLGNSIGSWSGFYRLSEPRYFSGTNPIVVGLGYDAASNTGELVVDMVRFVPVAADEDTDADGLPDWWMMQNFGHRTGEVGDLSRPLDTPAGDCVPNITKYALGLGAFTTGTQGRLASGAMTISNDTYLTITYTRPEPPPTGLTYSVELVPAIISGTWTTNGVVEASNVVNGDLRSITSRDIQPVGSVPQRFMRLKVSAP